jgi:hypothetical protein
VSDGAAGDTALGTACVTSWAEIQIQFVFDGFGTGGFGMLQVLVIDALLRQNRLMISGSGVNLFFNPSAAAKKRFRFSFVGAENWFYNAKTFCECGTHDCSTSTATV